MIIRTRSRCEDLETLRVALNLARHYDVPEFDVCLGHLEHLFRSATDPSAIEARLQEEIIEKHLKENKSALWHTLRQKIYPVLRGTNYDVLKVYYHLLLSCSQRESDKKRIEAYMMLLETVNKKLDGIVLVKQNSSFFLLFFHSFSNFPSIPFFSLLGCRNH